MMNPMKKIIPILALILSLCCCDFFQGPAGTNGTNGTNGTDGSTWLSGTGAPSASLGRTGDLYLNTSTCYVYRRTDSGWTSLVCIQGPAGVDGADGTNGVDGTNGTNGMDGIDGTNGTDGVDGADGATWHVGAAVPDDSLGMDRDLYLDSSTGDIYQKASGTWGTAFMNVTPASIRVSATVAAGGSLTLTHGIVADPGEALTYTGGFVVGDRVYPWDAYSSVYPALAQVTEPVNLVTDTLGSGIEPVATAALPSGNFVAASVEFPDGAYVRASLFGPDGSLLGSDFANTGADSTLNLCRVVPVSGGGFLLLQTRWEGANSLGSLTVYRYTEAAVYPSLTDEPTTYELIPSGSDTHVTAFDACLLANGDVALFWTGEENLGASPAVVAYFLAYDPVNETVTAGPVSLDAGLNFPYASVSICALQDGGAALAYVTDSDGTGSLSLQIREADGSLRGSVITPPFGSPSWYGDVAGLSGGGYVAAYMHGVRPSSVDESGYDSDTGGMAAGQGRFAVYNADGTILAQAPVGGSFAARGINPLFVSRIDVASLSTGGFVLGYRKLEQAVHFTPAAVKVALYSEGGALLAPEQTFLTRPYFNDQTNYTTTNSHDIKTISLCASGSDVFLAAGYDTWDESDGNYFLSGGATYCGLYRADTLCLTEAAGSASLANNTGVPLELRLSVAR